MHNTLILNEKTLYRNRYRIESARLKGWDYSSDGYYFVTVCTKNHECLFGDIKNGKMLLSEIGVIVKSEWERSFDIRSELGCECYVIMPNHIHGIVIIENYKHTHDRFDHKPCRDARPCVSTIKNGAAKRLPKSISSFIACFKSSATKIINEYRQTPGKPVWQPRFHDHVIRSENELFKIRKYIKYNPANWDNDRFNRIS